MRDELDDRLAMLADEAEAAEADQADRPLPPHVKVSRPGHARSKVLQVRLNPEEYEAIERIALARGLPASTVAREHLLRLITQTVAANPDVIDDPEHVRAQIVAAADSIKFLTERLPVGRRARRARGSRKAAKR